MDLTSILKVILEMALPIIKDLIESKFVPKIKRKAYEKFNEYADKLIEDLAQNAQKIAKEEDEVKKLAYIEGTKLGVETLRVLSDKLSKAAETIEKAIK